jgi:hypothetical protein
MKKKLVKVVQSDMPLDDETMTMVDAYFVCDDETVYIIPVLPTCFKDGEYIYKTHTHIMVNEKKNIVSVFEDYTNLSYYHWQIRYGNITDVVKLIL